MGVSLINCTVRSRRGEALHDHSSFFAIVLDPTIIDLIILMSAPHSLDANLLLYPAFCAAVAALAYFESGW